MQHLSIGKEIINSWKKYNAESLRASLRGFDWASSDLSDDLHCFKVIRR